jgi:hypothetical protein
MEENALPLSPEREREVGWERIFHRQNNIADLSSGLDVASLRPPSSALPPQPRNNVESTQKIESSIATTPSASWQTAVHGLLLPLETSTNNYKHQYPAELTKIIHYGK